MLASTRAGEQGDVVGVPLAVERLVAGIVGHGHEEHHAEQDQRRDQRRRRPPAASPVETCSSPLRVMTSA